MDNNLGGGTAGKDPVPNNIGGGAPPEGGAGNGPVPGAPEPGGGDDKKPAGFTQADIDKAVAEAQQKWAAERDEAERLSKLNKDDRAREQLRLDREKFDKERAEFAREKLVAETARQLAERRLPASLAARICGADADETKANLDTFEAEWNDALKAAVNERLKSAPPRVPETPSGGGSSLKDIVAASVKRGF